MDAFIENEGEREMLIKWLQEQAIPFGISVYKGCRRTLAQNRLQRQWCKEIAEQWDGHTPEEVRAYCKLTIGIPILREASEAFREKYDRLLKPMGYQEKMELMMEPIDLHVTRLMNTKEMTQYLDGIYSHFTEKGFYLTRPEDDG